MEIRFQAQKPVFTSRINPIKPFTIHTGKEVLNVAEVSLDEINSNGFIKKLTTFFSDNFASSSDDPGWKIFIDPEKLAIRKSMLKSLCTEYRAKLLGDDDYITLLVAKDKNNNIQGACFAYGFEDVPGCKDSVYYIDSLCVNPKYRGAKIGKTLLDKTIENVKDKFTDVFLTGAKKSMGFYNKMGFSELLPDNSAQKDVIDYIAIDRYDYPNYISLMTKPIQKNQPNWCINAKNCIDEMYKKFKSL